MEIFTYLEDLRMLLTKNLSSKITKLGKIFTSMSQIKRCKWRKYLGRDSRKELLIGHIAMKDLALVKT